MDLSLDQHQRVRTWVRSLRRKLAEVVPSQKAIVHHSPHSDVSEYVLEILSNAGIRPSVLCSMEHNDELWEFRWAD